MDIDSTGSSTAIRSICAVEQGKRQRRLKKSITHVRSNFTMTSLTEKRKNRANSQGSEVEAATANFNVTALRDLLSRRGIEREYSFEATRLMVASLLLDAVEKSGTSQTQICERIGKHRSFLSQLLSGNRNPTLRSIADVLWACDREIDVLSTRRLGVSRIDPVRMNQFLDSYERQVDAKYVGNVTITHNAEVEAIPTMWVQAERGFDVGTSRNSSNEYSFGS